MKTRSIAQILTLAALFASPSSAIVSNGKMRVYKDFFEGLLHHNMGNFFAKAASEDMTDIPLPELRSKLTEVQMTLQAKENSYENMDLQVFFDEAE